MSQKQLSLILFDFHNVLSRSDFYADLIKSNPQGYEKLRLSLFSPEAYPLLSRWMRGELSYREIHQMIEPLVGLSSSSLDKLLIKGVKAIELNNSLLEFSQTMRSQGIKIAILTDNFDVFDEVLVPNFKLDEQFDMIFSSASQKKLKLDNDGELIFKAISLMGSRPENTLFIDDLAENGDLLKKSGGLFYQYDNYIEGHRAFLQWFFGYFPKFANKLTD